MTLWSSFLYVTYKGKDVVRVNTRYRMYSVESQRKNVNYSSFRFREQKSKLSYKHAELETVKVKKKKKEYSGLLTVHSVFFVHRKGKVKNLFLFFFSFHCNTTCETLLNHDVPLMSFENSEHLLLNFLICKWEKYSIGKTQTTVPRPKKSHVLICSMNICSDLHFHILTWWDYLKIRS